MSLHQPTRLRTLLGPFAFIALVGLALLARPDARDFILEGSFALGALAALRALSDRVRTARPGHPDAAPIFTLGSDRASWFDAAGRSTRPTSRDPDALVRARTLARLLGTASSTATRSLLARAAERQLLRVGGIGVNGDAAGQLLGDDAVAVLREREDSPISPAETRTVLAALNRLTTPPPPPHTNETTPT